MTFFATIMVEEDNATKHEKAIVAAKNQIGKSARFVGQEATQLHDDKGMTMEYEGGAFFKRLTMINTLFGDVDHHLRRLARAGGFISAAA
jgi:alkylation response protein AidB-like acyl-CoA dehydrogenase